MQQHEARISGVLWGWGAIAEYMRCSAMSAWRWRRDEGLPVHGARHKRVWTTRSELDAWLEGRSRPESALDRIGALRTDAAG